MSLPVLIRRIPCIPCCSMWLIPKLSGCFLIYTLTKYSVEYLSWNQTFIKRTPSIQRKAVQVPSVCFPTFIIINTCIQRTPLLSGRRHLELDFYAPFFSMKPLSNTAKRIPWFLVHVLVIGHLSLPTDCHRNATFCYSVLFLQKFCSRSHDCVKKYGICRSRECYLTLSKSFSTDEY